MANEMSKDEETAFASMRNETIVSQAAEPEPEEAEQPESVDDEADEAAQAAVEGQGRVKTVPHQALHQEREEHRKTQAELSRLREERARFDERLKVIQEMNRPQPVEEQKPDPEDWTGRLEYAERKLAEMQAGATKQAEQTEAQRQEQARHAHLATTAREDVRAFKSKAPDYDDARLFYWNQRGPELMAHGLTQEQAVQAIEREELGIAASSFQRGVSPAETLYNIAKVRGYTRKAAPEAEEGGDEATDKVDRIATGQARSATLSGTGGGAAPTEMTAARLLAMSNSEFDTWTTKNPAKARRLMGEEPRRKGA